MIVFEEKLSNGGIQTTFCKDKTEAIERMLDVWMDGREARYYHPADQDSAPAFCGLARTSRDNFKETPTFPGNFGE